MRKHESQIFFRMRKLAQNNYFKPYFRLTDKFLAETLHLHAFSASQKKQPYFCSSQPFRAVYSDLVTSFGKIA